jgi:hypothetical protein
VAYCTSGELENLFEDFSSKNAHIFAEATESKSDEPEHKLE